MSDVNFNKYPFSQSFKVVLIIIIRPWGKCPGDTCQGEFCPVIGMVISSSRSIVHNII